MSPSELRLLSAGAAQGVAGALAAQLRAETGAELRARFMPVGALRESILAGETCDVLVSTPAMLELFARAGSVAAETVALLGRVHAGIAVRAGAAAPPIADRQQLHAALCAATRIYLPDPERATAGGHLVKVMQELAIYEALRPRLAIHPTGTIAMAALAASDERGCLGGTQVTEIRHVAGVSLVGILPGPFDLATPYAAAASAAARDPGLARRFVAMLAGTESAALRAAAGFEP
ncbi:MAG TPA: substrate-binding domain-containing protein [Casimicrobiaceae bacterium]|nr:substrate-binding domain-containing protein [Casimicrobiaceae bacterium]